MREIHTKVVRFHYSPQSLARKLTQVKNSYSLGLNLETHRLTLTLPQSNEVPRRLWSGVAEAAGISHHNDSQNLTVFEFLFHDTLSLAEEILNAK